MSEPNDLGRRMYQWMTDLFPICRSITGDGTNRLATFLQNSSDVSKDLMTRHAARPIA